MERVNERFFSSYRMSPFEVVYDKDSYSVEHVNDSGMVILRRLKDNRVVRIFRDSINYLFQYYDGEVAHFVVGDYSDCLNDSNASPSIMHFVDRGTSSLDFIKSFKGDGSSFNKIHFGDCSFVVDTNGYGGYVYNLKDKSPYYDHIYCDSEVKKYFGNDIILVSKRCSVYPNYDLKDNITFGIDSRTFDIVTPIWSELQQRLIPVYSKEEMDEILNKLHAFSNYNPSGFTIWYEVERYLSLLGNYFEKTDKVFNSNDSLNEQFVMKFVKK